MRGPVAAREGLSGSARRRSRSRALASSDPTSARTSNRVVSTDALAFAKAELAAGKYADAVASAGRAAAAQPLSADAYVVLGRALSTLGRDLEAVAPLRKAL